MISLDDALFNQLLDPWQQAEQIEITIPVEGSGLLTVLTGYITNISGERAIPPFFPWCMSFKMTGQPEVEPLLNVVKSNE
jgi:hypothetical protein